MDILQLENHWNYCRTLEKNLVTISNYIELDPDNFDTFSLELFKIILQSSAEFEVLCKEYCMVLDSTHNFQRANIDKLRETLFTNLPYLHDIEVSIIDKSYSFKPLEKWKNGKNPDWWQAYNAIKHNRNINFKQANLKNAVHAIGALKLINISFNRNLSGWDRGTRWTLLDVKLPFK